MYSEVNFHLYHQSITEGERYLNPQDINLPSNYKIEVFAQGLDLPSGFDFTDEGDLLIAESGYVSKKPKVIKLSEGRFYNVGEEFDAPVSGITYHKHDIYISHRGKISIIKPDETKSTIIDGLPKTGDYWGSNVAFDINDKMYFGQGTATNSGVVGNDNLWVYDQPFFCDNPGSYILLLGQNFEAQNLFSPKQEISRTGAFSPYGVANKPYEIRKGIIKASGSIMGSNPDGTELEQIAWGFRFPVYLQIDKGDQLYVSNQSYETRGSRPIANAPNEFCLVKKGVWYGWPDFAGGLPVSDPRFKPDGGKQPELLMLNNPNTPPNPYAIFPPGSYITGFDFNYNAKFGQIGDAYIAEFGGGGRIVPGEITPYVGVGYRVSKIDMKTGGVTTFAINKSGFPASITREGGFVRPVDIAFGPDGAMYILDFGTNVQNNLSEYIPNTGVIWRVSVL